jgi:hypothetical protein
MVAFSLGKEEKYKIKRGSIKGIECERKQKRERMENLWKCTFLV